MGTEDVAVVLERVNNVLALLQEVRAEVRTISRDGCSKASVHTEIQHDHEVRMRNVETWIATQRGQAAVISLIVSTVIGLVVAWIAR